MERLRQKITIFHHSLNSLDDGIELLSEYVNREHDKRIAAGLRDSIICRFKYCTDLFWKTLKIYLEDIQKISLEANSPAGVIRAGVEARILTEKQGQDFIEMVKSRNETSHIYREEVAQNISEKIPQYYKLMQSVMDVLSHSLKQS